MLRYLLGRTLQVVPTLLLVTVITFILVKLLPGDAALAFLGETSPQDPVRYEAMRRELGLDQPLPVQYFRWLGTVAAGDFGISARTREPVLEGIKARLPVTAQLALMTMAVALAIALPVGIISAARPRSWLDNVGSTAAIAGLAVPDFWLGIVLITLFSLGLGLLPPSGFKPLGEGVGQNLQLMILPALTLGASQAAVLMRQVRAALLEVLRHDYITTARAKGLREGLVVRRHALKNALIPVVTIIGLQTGRLFGGAVIVETIFALPGIGRVAADSIFFRDYAMLQGAILVLAVAVLLMNLITDILYSYLDPRIRYR
jgi:peptide/nickel transport system permease protein